MNPEANQPDLIITISHDKVRLDLLSRPSVARDAWSTSFRMDSIFLEDQISRSIDLALIENPGLIDHFPCVEVIVLDIPNICIPRYYYDAGKAGEIASRYLRMRAGDSLTTDFSSGDAVFCYTFPTQTLQMLREYYSNISCSHFSSVLWNYLSQNVEDSSESKSRMYFSLVEDVLTVIAAEGNKLLFLKNFRIRHQSDAAYFTIACSKMLRPKEHHLLIIENQVSSFEVPQTKAFRIDKVNHIPSLPALMSQYKPCVS